MRETEACAARASERAAALECLLDYGALPGASMRETLRTHLRTIDRLYPSRDIPISLFTERKMVGELLHRAMEQAVADWRAHGSVNYAAILDAIDTP